MPAPFELRTGLSWFCVHCGLLADDSEVKCYCFPQLTSSVLFFLSLSTSSPFLQFFHPIIAPVRCLPWDTTCCPSTALSITSPITHACQAFWQDEQGGRRRAMSARGKLLECYLEDVEIRDGTILVSLSLPAPIEAMRCLSNFLSPGHFNHSRTLRCLSQQHVRGSVLANPLLRAQPRRSCRTAGLQQH